MVSKLRATFLVVLFGLAGFALAQHGAGGDEASSECPPEFHAHTGGHHGSGDGHAHHLHVGVDDDRNGDDTICGFHVGRDGFVHVHTDNNDLSP